MKFIIRVFNCCNRTFDLQNNQILFLGFSMLMNNLTSVKKLMLQKSGTQKERKRRKTVPKGCLKKACSFEMLNTCLNGNKNKFMLRMDAIKSKVGLRMHFLAQSQYTLLSHETLSRLALNDQQYINC